MMHAEVDGELLSPMEMAASSSLLAAAGNETTRNAITHGGPAADPAPRPAGRWMADVDGSPPPRSRDRPLRDPVIQFRRTATRDTEIAGQPIGAGDKVVSVGTSRPTATSVFDDLGIFDVTRTPTSTSVSAAADRTSAWAPTWPGARSGSCSRSCSGGCPTSR